MAQYVDFKAPIISAGGNKLNKLRVMVDYQKGGINYFSGEFSKSGVFVYLTPCSYENGIVGTTISGDINKDGYKILLKPLSRKSQKQINLMAEKIMPHAQELADLFEAKNHKGVFDLVKTLTV